MIGIQSRLYFRHIWTAIKSALQDPNITQEAMWSLSLRGAISFFLRHTLHEFHQRDHPKQVMQTLADEVL